MASGAPILHRHRLAQAVAIDDVNHNDTPNIAPVTMITDSKLSWLLALLFIGFAARSFLKYYKDGASQLRSGDNCACSTALVQREKSAASSLPGKEITAIHLESARSKTSWRVIVAAMLLSLGSVIWLVSYLATASDVLDVFQVYRPVSLVAGSSCNEEILLLDHVFGYSYGQPFVGYYNPPSCDFDTVRINLTVTSKGRQYDRLAHMWLGDVEVFRTSTAEPTTDGIIWTYIKDLSQYNVLWQEPQKMIFDLGNLITDIYTGSFNVIVVAHFSHEGTVKTPDIIHPISAQSSASNSSSAFNVPDQEAKVSYQFDPDVSRAVVSISACGQSTEEFWWSNVFSSDTETFDDEVGELYGHSPFREIQLYIDDNLAGVFWPYPVIFTGGIVPGFWRPIVGTDAFDLRAPEIDITPFLPVLTDGSYHSFEIKIMGLNVSDDGMATLTDAIGSYWVVSGNIFLYLSDNATSSSAAPELIAPTPDFATTRHLVQNSTGANVSLAYSVRAERTLTVRSNDSIWSQNLSFSNFGFFNQEGLSQKTVQHTSGTAYFGDLADTGELSFEYPLFVNTTYGSVDGGLTIDAWMRRGLQIDSSGGPGISTYTLVSGPSHLRTAQWGSASYQSSADNTNSSSVGDTSDTFESDVNGVVYQRHVRAVNGTVVSDLE